MRLKEKRSLVGRRDTRGRRIKTRRKEVRRRAKEDVLMRRRRRIRDRLKTTTSVTALPISEVALRRTREATRPAKKVPNPPATRPKVRVFSNLPCIVFCN
jgi:hypothetical protein